MSTKMSLVLIGCYRHLITENQGTGHTDKGELEGLTLFVTNYYEFGKLKSWISKMNRRQQTKNKQEIRKIPRTN